MVYLQYSLSLLLSFLGLFFGVALAQIAPEELTEDMKRYLLIFKYIIVGLIFFIFSFYMLNKYYALLSIFALLFLIYYVLDTNQTLRKNTLAYFLLGFVFYFSSLNRNMALIQTSLILLLGFPVGTLTRYSMIKKQWKYVYLKIIKKYGFYILIGLFLPFVF